MTNTLYCFGESGNAYKAALALELSGIALDPALRRFLQRRGPQPGLRAINPMGEVPVLDADGTILTQSGVIQDWVMDETGKLCGDGSKETRREILRWTIFDNQKVSGMAGPLRFMMNFLPRTNAPPRSTASSRGGSRLRCRCSKRSSAAATGSWATA
jgi:glutathione S-transferase